MKDKRHLRTNLFLLLGGARGSAFQLYLETSTRLYIPRTYALLHFRRDKLRRKVCDGVGIPSPREYLTCVHTSTCPIRFPTARNANTATTNNNNINNINNHNNNHNNVNNGSKDKNDNDKDNDNNDNDNNDNDNNDNDNKSNRSSHSHSPIWQSASCAPRQTSLVFKGHLSSVQQKALQGCLVNLLGEEYALFAKEEAEHHHHYQRMDDKQLLDGKKSVTSKENGKEEEKEDKGDEEGVVEDEEDPFVRRLRSTVSAYLQYGGGARAEEAGEKLNSQNSPSGNNMKRMEKRRRGKGWKRGEGSGFLCMECGSGKTVVALALIACLRTPTIVVVHKTFLINQWKKRIQTFLPECRIGILQRDETDVLGKDVVLVMLQSLCKRDYNTAQLLADYHLCIFDECHHISARVFSQSMFKIPARLCLGMSATPVRRDGLSFLLWYFFGEMCYRSTSTPNGVDDPEASNQPNSLSHTNFLMSQRGVVECVQLNSPYHTLNEGEGKGKGGRKRKRRKARRKEQSSSENDSSSSSSSPSSSSPSSRHARERMIPILEDNTHASSLAHLVSHAWRNRFLAWRVMEAAYAGRKVLLLSDRRGHLETIKHLVDSYTSTSLKQSISNNDDEVKESLEMYSKKVSKAMERERDQANISIKEKDRTVKEKEEEKERKKKESRDSKLESMRKQTLTTGIKVTHTFTILYFQCV